MGRYDGILLMSDFDNTLFCDNTVSEENRAAIRYFQARGGLFSLCSGRLPSHLLNCTNYFTPNTWSAMMNGMIFCDASTKIVTHETILDDGIVDFAREVIAACPELDRIHFHSFDEMITFKGPFTPDIDFGELPKKQYKVIFRAPTEVADEYKQIVTKLAEGRYCAARSWKNGIDVQAFGVHKGTAVETMRKLLEGRIDTVIAAGDYENDVEMIKAADIGYAVDNAVPELKAVADRITVSCHDNAIARIISEL